MRKKRVKKIKSAKKLIVYDKWTQEQLDFVPAWAIVKNNPSIVVKTGHLNHDDDTRYWVPINMNSAPLQKIYWMDVVMFKFNGKITSTMCRACEHQLMCAADGQHINPKFECKAARQTFVEIKRRKKRAGPEAEVAAPDQ